MFATFMHLFSVAAASATPACASKLTEPSITHPDFVVVTARTPVCSQCSGDCSYMAVFGHMENLLKRRFNADWFSLHVLDRHYRRHLKAGLESPARASIRRILELDEPNEEKFDLVAGEYAGGSAFALVSEIGLVDHADFAFTDEFLDDLAKNHHGEGVILDPKNPLRSLVQSYESIFAELAHAQETREPESNIALLLERVVSWQRRMMVSARAGFRGDYEPATRLRNLGRAEYGEAFDFSGNRGFFFHTPLIYPDGEDCYPNPVTLPALIRRINDAGFNLCVGYFEHSPFYDEAKHHWRLPTGFDRTRWLATNPPTRCHMALIEGYRLDETGRVDAVLIKNSHGKNRYIQGYQTMDTSYLIELGYAVFRDACLAM